MRASKQRGKCCFIAIQMIVEMKETDYVFELAIKSKDFDSNWQTVMLTWSQHCISHSVNSTCDRYICMLQRD